MRSRIICACFALTGIAVLRASTSGVMPGNGGSPMRLLVRSADALSRLSENPSGSAVVGLACAAILTYLVARPHIARVGSALRA